MPVFHDAAERSSLLRFRSALWLVQRIREAVPSSERVAKGSASAGREICEAEEGAYENDGYEQTGEAATMTFSRSQRRMEGGGQSKPYNLDVCQRPGPPGAPAPLAEIPQGHAFVR